MTGNLIPITGDTYDLGSSANPFRHLYMASSTIYMGGLVLKATDKLEFEITDGSGNVKGIKEDLSFTRGIFASSKTKDVLQEIEHELHDIKLLTDNVVNGSGAASKVVTLDSNKDFSGIRNLTIEGFIEADINGGATIGNTTNRWSHLYLSSGTMIDFNSSIRIEHNASGSIDIIGGDLTCDGDITAFKTSDKRFKSNITRIEDPLEKINKIGGYNFEWNELSKKYTTHRDKDVGLIAQEIEKILPEACVTRDNGFKAVQYEKVIPLLVECVKKQGLLIKDLHDQIDEINKINKIF